MNPTPNRDKATQHPVIVVFQLAFGLERLSAFRTARIASPHRLFSQRKLPEA